MTESLTEWAALPDDMQFIAEALKNGQLHKVFMICPDAHDHIELDNNGQFTFTNNFLPHFNKHLEAQPLYFNDDNPLDYHRFSKPGNIMLTVLLPPEKIVSVDGRLGVRKENLSVDHIVGAYLFNNSPQFYQHVDFNPHALKETVN